MLINKLGYRDPDKAEIINCLALSFEDRFVPPYLANKSFYLQSGVLSADPFIAFSGIVPFSPLGVAGMLPPTGSTQPRWFLLSPTWSIETKEDARNLRISAVLHKLRCSYDNFVFVCNTMREMELLHEAGEAAVFINKTCGVSEQVYKPLPGVKSEFSAVYNARLEPWKRHDLTLGIKTCLFVFYRSGDNTMEQKQFEKDLFARHARLAPGHLFANELDEFQVPVRISPDQVNAQQNRARVGLCLSELEGAMFASVEYLLAGLPVVTVPNTGGRDGYFDDDHCITVGLDAALVNEAVEELIARAIPPEEVRNRTLQRLVSDRTRFATLLNDILSENGRSRDFSAARLFGPHRLMRWMPWQEAVAQTGLMPA